MNMIPNIAVLGLRPSLTLLLAAICACAVGSVGHNAAMKATAPLRLDFSDDGKQLKLLVRHPEIGLVCELHCYEAGPFHYGTGVKRDDGSVVLVKVGKKAGAPKSRFDRIRGIMKTDMTTDQIMARGILTAAW